MNRAGAVFSSRLAPFGPKRARTARVLVPRPSSATTTHCGEALERRTAPWTAPWTTSRATRAAVQTPLPSAVPPATSRGPVPVRTLLGPGGRTEGRTHRSAGRSRAFWLGPWTPAFRTSSQHFGNIIMTARGIRHKQVYACWRFNTQSCYFVIRRGRGRALPLAPSHPPSVGRFLRSNAGLPWRWLCFLRMGRCEG